MKIDWTNSTALTAVIIGIILVVALAYSIFVIKNQPPQMGFTVNESYTFPYSFDQQGWRVELNDNLKEISGITSLNENQVLAIQDEKGILFTVNLNTGNVVSQMQFDKDRDYEDVCLVGDDHVFVLERDGDLYQFHLNEHGSDSIPVKYETLFSYRNDTEAMCFDPSNNQLLISPKEGAPEGSEPMRNIRGIYAFDLIDYRLDSIPMVRIAEKEIGRIVGNGGKPYDFKPSAMAIHPTSRNIYILASVGKILIVIAPNGDLQHVQLLSKKQFPQPEGMAFDADGNLLISSEGVDSPAAITRFSPKKP